MTKKLTAPGKEKIVKDIIKLLKKLDCYQGIRFIWSGKCLDVGTQKFVINKELPTGHEGRVTWVEPSEVYSDIDPKTDKPWSAKHYDEFADDELITFFFESSPLYEYLQGSFGWTTADKFREGLEKILEPYGLEYSDHYSYAIGIHRG